MKLPGLCAVIDLSGNAGAAAARGGEGEELLERMVRSLLHQERHEEQFRYVSPPFYISTVGYRTRGRTVHLAASTAGEPEIWLGEFYDDRATSAVAGPGDVPGAWNPAPAPNAHLRRIDAETPAGDHALGAHLAGSSGGFAGIRFAPGTGRFAIFNDVIASVPVCVRNTGRWMFVAPEIKALVLADRNDVEGDLGAAAFFLQSGYLPPVRTWFRGVEKLAPASLVSGRAGAGETGPPHATSYWDFHVDPQNLSDEPSDTLSAGLSDLIERTVASQTLPGERTAILLSGGYDSRGLLGAALRAGRAVETVTWGHEEDLPGSDAVVARRLASAAGVPHHFFRLDTDAIERNAERWVWMTDGAVDGLYNYPEGDAVFRRIGDAFDVIIRGDESFGMRWPYPIPDDRVARACIDLYPLRWHAIYEDVLRDGAYRELCDASDRVMEEISGRIVAADPVDRKEEYYLKVRFHCYLNVLNYFKTQSVHLRNPLLDRRVLEFARTLPRPLRRSKRLYKETVTRRLAPFPGIPFASRTSLVPWQRVASSSPELSRFFRDRVLETPGLMARLVDRDAMGRQLDTWLSPDRTRGPSSVDVREPRFQRVKELARHVAYHPATPARVRDAILPSRSPRRPFSYAFRVLVLAVYIGELASRGIAPEWK
jgi:asparagine synthetase B (glutamine-hydrolysing)